MHLAPLRICPQMCYPVKMSVCTRRATKMEWGLGGKEHEERHRRQVEHKGCGRRKMGHEGFKSWF